MSTTTGASTATGARSVTSDSPSSSSGSLSTTSGSDLVTENGKTSIADGVVRKIAGIATREVSGVHNLGAGASRTFGSIKERIPGTSGPNISQGVSVEVGERQAAIDLDVVVEYGVSIVDLAHAIRRNVISSVERMTGLQVTEVNVAVDDIYIAGDDDSSSDQPSRVQ